MYLPTARSAVLGLLGLVSMAGCAGVTPEQLQAYDEAYESARQAGSLIYAEAVPAIVAGQNGSDGDAAEAPSISEADLLFVRSLGPVEYARGACRLGNADLPESVLARCNALVAITSFNEILLKLSAGTAPAGVGTELGALSASLGGLQSLLQVPAVGAVLPPPVALVLDPAIAIVDEAAGLARASAVAAKLEEARPALRALITALREDVPRLHLIQREYYVGSLREVKQGADDRYRAVATILREYGPPSSAALLSERVEVTSRIDSGLEKIDGFVATRGPVGSFPSDDSGPAYHAGVTAELRSELVKLEPLLERGAELGRSWQSFESALRRYDDILVEIDQTLNTLGSVSTIALLGADGPVAQWLTSAAAIQSSAREIESILAN